jgi:hypothetical protein
VDLDVQIGRSGNDGLGDGRHCYASNDCDFVAVKDVKNVGLLCLASVLLM